MTDITYSRTWEGWLYLAIVMDLFSRKIVGWSTRATIHRQLVLDAVLMAVKRRRHVEQLFILTRAANTAATIGVDSAEPTASNLA